MILSTVVCSSALKFVGWIKAINLTSSVSENLVFMGAIQEEFPSSFQPAATLQVSLGE